MAKSGLAKIAQRHGFFPVKFLWLSTRKSLLEKVTSGLTIDVTLNA
jgi:hypothetical protein